MAHDENVLTAVRHGLSDTHMTAGVDGIIARGRALRLRRRSLPVAAVTAVAAGAAASVLALAPSGVSAPGSTGGSSQATLTAFTVTRQHSDTVDVTLRQLAAGWSAANRAALQRELRADGVPAVVGPLHGIGWTGTTRPPAQVRPAPRCYPSPVAKRVFTMGGSPGTPQPGISREAAFEIHPAMIPRGARVRIVIDGTTYHHEHPVAVILPGFVITSSGRCLSL
jgi:hypothetical protein